jgi:hypothetical protein
MAGLTAALALLRQGHNVTVIEYQDRVGGRLLSLALPAGQFTEAGGGHFRSNMPYVLSYIRHFGLPVVSLNDGLPRYTVGGKQGDGAHLAGWPWDMAPDERGVTVSSSLNRYLYRAGLDTDTVLDSRWPDPETLARLDTITVGDLIAMSARRMPSASSSTPMAAPSRARRRRSAPSPISPTISGTRTCSGSWAATAACPTRSPARSGRSASFSTPR